jgi:hypothetical protein
MKKYIYIILILFSLGVTSCNKFVEGYDASPNLATNATLPLLLSSAELGLESSYTGTLVREPGMFVQQVAGTDQQFHDLAGYGLKEDDNENDWNTLYTIVVFTSNNLIATAKPGGAYFTPYYIGIAKVLKAMAIGLVTDTWGDVPATEAGMSLSGNLTPKYEAQQNVIAYVQQLLSEALTSFASTDDQTGKILPSNDDFLLNGDIDKWVNTTSPIC